MAEEMKIDERVLRAHLELGPFLSGVAKGRWRLVEIAWPYVTFAVSAAQRENSPEEFFVRFELSNYPQDSPTADLWDMDSSAKLDQSKRPYGSARVSKAFRADRSSLYLPCDRLEIAQHPEWLGVHPSMLWSSDGDITQYLRIIHELLNSVDYSGASCSQA